MKNQFKPGQLVEQTMNGVRGIVLGFQDGHRGRHNPHCNKAVVYCFFAPHNMRLVGKQVELSLFSLKVVDEKSV